MRDLMIDELSHVYGAGGKGRGSDCGPGGSKGHKGPGSKGHKGRGSKGHSKGTKGHSKGGCW